LANNQISFLILFVLFIIAIETSEVSKINISENLFMIYALGFTLEKIAAMQEHGIKGLGSPVPVCQSTHFGR